VFASSTTTHDDRSREKIRFHPSLDIPAPDVMTSGQHMLWTLDEYETMLGARVPASITGKPLGLGSSPARVEATGYGVVAILLDALAHACRERGWV
jgi:glutamate dehydrogenase (NAD(P)+)